MCLLVVRKKGNWLPSEEEIENAWQSNPDGFGIGYSHQGKLYIGKTLELEQAKGFIRALPANAPAILHWRWKTHGEVNPNNCHPFQCLNGEWVGAHNGVLTKQPLLAGKTDSESYLMTLKGRPSLKAIEKDIDRLGYGKIGLVSVKGEVLIAHEGEGEWRVKKEVWESNSGLDGWNSGSPYASYFTPRRSLIRLSCDWCGAPAMYGDSKDLYCEGCANDWENINND